MEPTININQIECPAAEQLEDAMAHLSELHLLLGIHVMRLRTTAWERHRKQAQRMKQRAQTERPQEPPRERLVG